jgi:hypothetical protein
VVALESLGVAEALAEGAAAEGRILCHTSRDSACASTFEVHSSYSGGLWGCRVY